MKCLALTIGGLLFSLLSVAQSSWLTVIDNNSLYLTGSPVVSMTVDSFDNKLFLGGAWTTLTNASTSVPCCDAHLRTFDGYVFNDLDCMPYSGQDTAIILSFSSAADTAYNQSFVAVGGVFTDQSCVSIPPTSYRNFINYANLSPATYIEMSLSDTVFEVEVLADYDNPCAYTAEYYFRTYIAGKCVMCDISTPSSVDSSRYVGFFDPATNCNLTLTKNYMQGGTNGPVYAIEAVDTSNVYAGGIFDSSGTITANNIAKWNGVSWDSLGSGINGTVKVLLYAGGMLYAGGTFTTAGGIPANNIAMWNGTAWAALGSGTNGTVKALTMHNGELYAGGSFTQAGSSSVNYVAKWDGVNWSDLSGGRNGEVFSLASFQGDLYVGGNFSGGSNDTAAYFAVYHDSTMSVSENANAFEVTTFPNPSDEIITLNISGAKGPFEIIVRNMLGEIILADRRAVGTSIEFNTSGLPEGMYTLEVNSEKRKATKLISVQH
jgi:hypothetical protein